MNTTGSSISNIAGYTSTHARRSSMTDSPELPRSDRINHNRHTDVSLVLPTNSENTTIAVEQQPLLGRRQFYNRYDESSQTESIDADLSSISEVFNENIYLGCLDKLKERYKNIYFVEDAGWFQRSYIRADNESVCNLISDAATLIIGSPTNASFPEFEIPIDRLICFDNIFKVNSLINFAGLFSHKELNESVEAIKALDYEFTTSWYLSNYKVCGSFSNKHYVIRNKLRVLFFHLLTLIDRLNSKVLALYNSQSNTIDEDLASSDNAAGTIENLLTKSEFINILEKAVDKDQYIKVLLTEEDLKTNYKEFLDGNLSISGFINLLHGKLPKNKLMLLFQQALSKNQFAKIVQELQLSSRCLAKLKNRLENELKVILGRLDLIMEKITSIMSKDDNSWEHFLTQYQLIFNKIINPVLLANVTYHTTDSWLQYYRGREVSPSANLMVNTISWGAICLSNLTNMTIDSFVLGPRKYRLDIGNKLTSFAGSLDEVVDRVATILPIVYYLRFLKNSS